MRPKDLGPGNFMQHDVQSGICSFRQRIPTGHLRRAFGRRLTDAIQEKGAEVLEEMGAARRTLPNFGQVYGSLTRDARNNLPDFEEALATWGRKSAVFLADVQVFAGATEMVTTAFDIDECVITPDGFAMVGVYSRDRRVEIREGDAFLGGAVFTADLKTGACTISPRLVRLVCANGLILPLRAEEGIQTYERSPMGDTRGSIEEAVHSAFSGQVLQSSVRPLGPAASWHVTDPIATLAQFSVVLDEETSAQVLAVFKAAEDDTVYGTVNALSQAARDTRDPRKRLALETKAGRLLPRLEILGQQMLGMPQDDAATNTDPDPIRTGN